VRVAASGAERRLPRRLGPYVVHGHMDRGGPGRVLRAWAPDGRDVAVRLFEGGAAAAELAAFARGYALRADLGAEAGFVPVVDAGESPSGPYLVTPYVPGGNLARRLGEPLPLEASLGLVEALARALGAAHRRGIVHGDLRPANALFTAEGRLLVADLGLAEHFGGGAAPSAYAAPELRDGAGAVGPAADVFSLGAILLEALTGRGPLPEVGAPAAPTLRALRPDAPAWLEALAAAALDPRPGARPADGDAMAAALAAGRGGRRLPAPAVARRPALLVGALLAGALAVGTGVVAWWPGRAGASPTGAAPAAAPPPAGRSR